MANNRIDKFESITSLKDAPQLTELGLDGNPIFHHKNYFEFCLSTCANLKHLDLRKITPEMRDSNSLSASKGDGKLLSASKDDNKDNGNVSTDISPDKPTT